MFKRISKILLFSLISICFFSFNKPKEVNAAKFVSGDYTLKREEILHDDLYVAGDKVEINGIVDGDAYIAATNISITGTISDDLYVAGDTVTVSGNVYGDLVSIGSTIKLSGTVGENCYLFGGTINSTGSIGEDLITIGGDVNTSGQVDEDLITLGGNINVRSTITEDLVAFGSKLSLSKADVIGEVYREEAKFATQDMTFIFNPNVSTWSIVYTSLLSGISMFLVGAFLIFVMPVKTLNIVKKSTSSGEEFIKSFATGFIVLFVASIPILLLLLLTIVGIPLAGILLALLAFLVVYAKLWVEIGIGKEILNSCGNTNCSYYTALLVGRTLSILAGLIPVVGILYSLILTLTGTGAFFRMKYDLFSSKKINTPSKPKKAIKSK